MLGQSIYMERAIELSKINMENNQGGPFGAVIVRQGKIIAEGWNCVTSKNDPTAHAEVEAIRKATSAIKNYSLEGCEIYTSCEPCPMCLAAIYWARIDKIFYANSREDAAHIHFDDDFLYKEIPKNVADRKIPTVRILAEQALKIFKLWQNKLDKIPY